MKIQIITHNSELVFSNQIVVNSINSPMSFDDFDINIIDLSDDELWHYHNTQLESIDCIKDFDSICSIVSGTKKAIVFYVFPKNSIISWGYSSNSRRYLYRDELKNRLNYLNKDVLSYIIPYEDNAYYRLTYERNKTSIKDYLYDADFYFSSYLINKNDYILTRSTSEKTTTIKLTDKMYLTTCQILSSQELMMNYVNSIFKLSSEEEVPLWVNEYDFYNDNELNNKLEAEKKIVSDAENRIEEICNQKKINNKYKSVLYTSGDELAEAVFSILQIVFDEDLSGFKDVFKEDFIIQKKGRIFVGEIKGVVNNVQYNYIFQSVRHFVSYADEHVEVDKNNIKPLLIINPLRKVPINDREKVNDDQIKFAMQNNCLIIETVVLLKMLDKVLKKELTTLQCIDIIFNKSGILTTQDLNI